MVGNLGNGSAPIELLANLAHSRKTGRGEGEEGGGRHRARIRLSRNSEISSPPGHDRHRRRREGR